MKKYLKLLIIPIVSLFLSQDVKAEEKYLEFQEGFSLIQSKINSIGSDNFNEGLNNLIDYYKNNYKNDYSYYVISVFLDGLDRLNLIIHIGNDDSFNGSVLFIQSGTSQYEISDARYMFEIYFDEISSLWSDIETSHYGLDIFEFSESKSYIKPYNYYYSNFDYYYKGSKLKTFQTDGKHLPLTYLDVDDKIYVPLYDNKTLYSVYNSIDDFMIQPYYLYDNYSNLEPDVDVYTTVNLNDYSYVALSLKNYNVKAFNTVSYVKGQLCPTKVYDYGLKETTNTDRCNPSYSDFTPVRLYISDYDITNHSIYYFKAYNKNIENLVRFDSTIFNIHYITEEESDNPILDINGHKYSTISFDKLSSSANKNESENFVPGSVEEVTVEGFFEKPLELLKSVWGAIQAIFTIITEFILLLPPVMQGFLYTSFGIAIVLGLIKILL